MSAAARNLHRPTAADGFIVVAVLWIIAALATLASIYAVYVVNTAQAVAQNDDRIKAEAAISAGLALTASQLNPQQDEHATTRGRFVFQLGSARIAVMFVPEASRIDLNAAPKPLLAGLFAALGAPAEQAENCADRVVSWRTKPHPSEADNEVSLYRTAGLAYGPREAPFASTAELWLVRDLPPQLVERAIDYVTVFSGSAGVDVLDARPAVLAALPGMTPDRLDALLRQRRAAPEDDKALLAMLGPLQAAAATAKSSATRVRIDISFDNGRQVKAQAVIRPAGGAVGPPYHVLFWRDDLDGSLPGERAEGA
jgi:general secretion pathway protein K